MDQTSWEFAGIVASICSLIISLFSIFISLIIGGFAIWLSVTFYRMSSTMAGKTGAAAKDVLGVVGRLEDLFNRMYSETFSMVRDTQAKLWDLTSPAREGLEEQRAEVENKVKALRESMVSEIKTEMEAVVGKADNRLQALETRVLPLVEDSIEKMRKVESEARDEADGLLESTIRERLYRVIEVTMRPNWCTHPTLKAVVHHPLVVSFSQERVVDVLRDMRDVGEITLDSPEFGPVSKIVSFQQACPDL